MIYLMLIIMLLIARIRSMPTPNVLRYARVCACVALPTTNITIISIVRKCLLSNVDARARCNRALSVTAVVWIIDIVVYRRTDRSYILESA